MIRISKPLAKVLACYCERGPAASPYGAQVRIYEQGAAPKLFASDGHRLIRIALKSCEAAARPCEKDYGISTDDFDRIVKDCPRGSDLLLHCVANEKEVWVAFIPPHLEAMSGDVTYPPGPSCKPVHHPPRPYEMLLDRDPLQVAVPRWAANPVYVGDLGLLAKAGCSKVEFLGAAEKLAPALFRAESHEAVYTIAIMPMQL